MTGSRTLIRAISLAVALLVFAPLVVPSLARADDTRVQQLQQELNKINEEFTRAGKAYDEAFWALDETEKAIEDATARIAENEGQLDEAQKILQNRVASWYRADNLGVLEFLLGAQDFNDLVTRLEFASRIAQDDSAAIGRVEGLLVELREDRERMEVEQAHRADRVEEFKSERDALQKRLGDKRAEYDSLQRELAEEARRAEAARKAEVARKAAEEARRTLTARTPAPQTSRRAPAENSGAPTPAPALAAAPGANGMIFPVAGPHYYSDTWGASRDGGRRSHKGTDIMAATGVPVVATMSGTVSSRNGANSGLYLKLQADNGWSFHYMHLDSIIVGSGRVTAGQTIGTVGYTGNASASAPHLHFEIHLPGQGAVNPYPYLRQMQGK